MPEKTDLEILAELGVEPVRKTKTATTPRESRIIAGFEDIQKFVDEHGHPPRHGEGLDIFERLYAVRLDRLRQQPDCVALLKDIDRQSLIAESDLEQLDVEGLDDAELLAELGVSADGDSGITTLRHVRSRGEIRVAEEIADRRKCEDFADFEPIFAAMKADIASGVRQTRRFERKSEIEQGRFFIVGGLTAYVAEAGEESTNASGNRDRRLRVIFDNGTESNLLARSLQKALTQDQAGRRITEPNAGPLFDQEINAEGDETGTIYVLRSLSDHPQIAKGRDVIHKIGVTGGEVERRFGNAQKEPTFLMAPVELAASFRLIDVNRTALEHLLHRFFAPARLDITIRDRFGEPIKPREWFVVPLPAIRDAVAKIQDGTLHRYEYRPEQAGLVPRGGSN